MLQSFYKHKQKYLLAFLSFLVLCTSCGAAPASRVSVSTGSEERLGQAQNLELLTVGADLIQGVGNETGFYYIEPRPEDILTGNIRYIDYATGQDIYLSSQLNSDHSTVEDPSYLDSIIGKYSLFIYQENLYFLRSGAPGYTENSELAEKAASALYQMEPDGSNRKLLYKGNGSSELLPYAVGGGQALYFLRQNSGGIDLLAISLSGGAEQVIASFDFGTQLIGCYGSVFFLSTVEPATATQAASYKVESFDLQDGATREIVHWTDDDFGTPIVIRDTLYFIKREAAVLETYSLQGEHLQSISLAQAIPEGSSTYERIYTIGSNIFIPCYDSNTKTYYTTVFNAAEESISRTDIPFYDSEKGVEFGAVVLAETEGSFLLIAQRDFEPVKMPLGDGTTASVTFPTYKFALVSQTDYFASQRSGIKYISPKS